MDEFRFSDGRVVSDELFHQYNLSKLKDADLAVLSQKCMLLLKGGASSQLVATQMLAAIASEKSFRAARSSRTGSNRLMAVLILAVVAMGLVQAWAAIYSTRMQIDAVQALDEEEEPACSPGDDGVAI